MGKSSSGSSGKKKSLPSADQAQSAGHNSYIQSFMPAFIKQGNSAFHVDLTTVHKLAFCGKWCTMAKQNAVFSECLARADS